MLRTLLCLMPLLQLVYHSAATGADLPYRESYPEITTIETPELRAGLDRGDLLVVDVRSPVEYGVIHIEGALNLPYGDARFTQRLQALASQNKGKRIVVYCNGVTCIKCYKAAEDALYAGMPDVLAFDAGISAWAETYPSLTIFEGKPLHDPEVLLASETRFKDACLDYERFLREAEENKDKTVVIDARDPVQRTRPLPGINRTLKVPLDKLAKNIIAKGHLRDKRLLIFDQVGRQVRWLQFLLEKNGYRDYHFLAGGATAVLRSQDYR
ncbi:MAG: hypothetical protein Kow0089_24000 [Desulfobulbaceae bacterium]